MSVNELYQENEEMRNTVSFLRNQLHKKKSLPIRTTRDERERNEGGEGRGRSSPSPPRFAQPNGYFSSVEGDSEKEKLALENKFLRDKVLFSLLFHSLTHFLVAPGREKAQHSANSKAKI